MWRLVGKFVFYVFCLSDSSHSLKMSSPVLCQFYFGPKGHCNRGNACGFSHSKPSESEVLQRVVVCPHYLRGVCLFGDTCRLPHSGLPKPFHPTTITSSRPYNAFGSCKYFVQGRCSKGDACTFSHSATPFVPTVKVSQRTAVFKQTNTFGPCKFFALGSCSKGAACPFPHIGQKLSLAALVPEICSFDVQELCKKGTSCHFIHNRPVNSGLLKPMVRLRIPPRNFNANLLFLGRRDSCCGTRQFRFDRGHGQHKGIHSTKK